MIVKENQGNCQKLVAFGNVYTYNDSKLLLNSKIIKLLAKMLTIRNSSE